MESPATFAIMNHIRAETPEAFQKVVESFKTRRGLVEGRPGFKALLILANPDRREVLVITVWESKKAFEAWVESEEFKKAHERARSRRLEGTSSEGIEFEVVDFKTPS
ncbi:MAG: antibiotic biosynthesis monooxygenase [Aeropyrum sp.]|nr:antibiotic biosynthesis monooxygenase [Aeropyrum sp.]MCE4615702.1 antibiotic biosynthesis monooxygenase [Aeropyrum sp.]